MTLYNERETNHVTSFETDKRFTKIVAEGIGIVEN